MEKTTITREEKVELYNMLVASHAEAERKGATIPYTSLNGHMYSFLSKDDTLALRLPEHERRRFLHKYKTILVEQYGIVQKEYVVVPDSLLQNTNEMREYFNISYTYVSSLKAKAGAKNQKEGLKQTRK
jgi:hypothetical protein